MLHPLCSVKASADYLHNRADKLAKFYARNIEENVALQMLGHFVPYVMQMVDYAPRKMIIIGTYYAASYSLEAVFNVAEPYFDGVNCTDLSLIGKTNNTDSDPLAEYFGL